MRVEAASAASKTPLNAAVQPFTALARYSLPASTLTPESLNKRPSVPNAALTSHLHAPPSQPIQRVTRITRSLADTKQTRPVEASQRVYRQLALPAPALRAADAFEQCHEEPTAEIFLCVHARAFAGPFVWPDAPPVPSRQRYR
jgi:hypothetical protein